MILIGNLFDTYYFRKKSEKFHLITYWVIILGRLVYSIKATYHFG